MTDTFQKPLTIDKTDNYTYTVNSQWLNGETIVNHAVVVDAKVTKNNSGVTDNVIGVSLTGVSKGAMEMHFEYETSGGRSDCAKTSLIVTENCQ